MPQSVTRTHWGQRFTSVHHARGSRPNTLRNSGFGFELSHSDLLHYCCRPIDRVLALRHCKQGLYYLSSPVRDLPGPKSVNWLTGSLPRSGWEPDSQKFQLEWARQYGPVVKYYGWFNVSVHAS